MRLPEKSQEFSRNEGTHERLGNKAGCYEQSAIGIGSEGQLSVLLKTCA